jgi:hypothetical protein
LSAVSQSRFVRIDFISVVMLNLSHIDLVVLSVRADPFDPHDTFLEIDGDASRSITALYISCGRPLCLFEFVEPGI